MRKKLQVGLVGYGSIGSRHYKVMQGSRAGQVVGIADPKVSSSEDVRGVPFVGSVDELIAECMPDVLLLCSPSSLHADQTLLAASHGIHVISEKPVATTRNDALSMVSSCGQAGVQLDVVYQYRHSAGAVRLREAILKNELGDLLFTNATVYWRRDAQYFAGSGAWRASQHLSGGGALMNQGVHALDLLLWLVGPIVSTAAVMSNRRSTGGVEDCIAALLEFEGGAAGSLQVTTASSTNAPMEISICGTNASAKLTGGSLELQFADGTTETVVEPETRMTLHARHIEAALEAIAAGHTVPVPGLEAMQSLDAALSIYAAATSQSVVDLRETNFESVA